MENQANESKARAFNVLAQATFWSLYREAGYPFGKTEKGLAIWVRFGTGVRTN
jgi:hypothetical protein